MTILIFGTGQSFRYFLSFIFILRKKDFKKLEIHTKMTQEVKNMAKEFAYAIYFFVWVENFIRTFTYLTLK